MKMIMGAMIVPMHVVMLVVHRAQTDALVVPNLLFVLIVHLHVKEVAVVVVPRVVLDHVWVLHKVYLLQREMALIQILSVHRKQGIILLLLGQTEHLLKNIILKELYLPL